MYFKQDLNAALSILYFKTNIEKSLRLQQKLFFVESEKKKNSIYTVYQNDDQR